jgi:hypothetical protein
MANKKIKSQDKPPFTKVAVVIGEVKGDKAHVKDTFTMEFDEVVSAAKVKRAIQRAIMDLK